MTWNYAFTSNIWPSVCTVLLLIALAVYSGRRRSVAGALPFMIGCLFAAAWAAGSVMEYATADLATKIFWIKFQATWQLPVTTAATCFILEYTWPGRWLTRRNLALLSVPPILILLVILTDNQYHLAWRGFTFTESIQPQFGVAGWIGFAYAFGVLGILNLVVFGWLFLRSPQNRWPVVLVLVGQFGGRLLYMLERIGLLHSILPIDLLGLAFEFLMYGLALFGFRIFDPISMARQAAIEQLQYGMLVLDPQGKIISMNPAAERILATTTKAARGKPIGDLLPAYSMSLSDGPIEAQTEICLPEMVRDGAGPGPVTRDYELDTSTLRDWRAMAVGSLLMLRDVTEKKQAQTQILEQQRALAMLHEREQLARELHDSTSQVLAFASLKLGAARQLLADGKLDKTDGQLEQLENAVTEAHADLREDILNLRFTPTREKPFFSALQQYLDGYRRNYSIQVELSIGAGVDKGIFAPDAQLQVFRILQEALSNARKHAQIDCVQVSIKRDNSLVHVCIQDNGRGFDLQQASEKGEGHFGLRNMHERAEQLGGSLRVDSAPGRGTCVTLEIPVNGTSAVNREQ